MVVAGQLRDNYAGVKFQLQRVISGEQPGRTSAFGARRERFDTLKAVGFEGRRVILLESRRAAEMAELVRRQGGEVYSAPSMREVPAEASGAVEFGERLLSGGFDMMVLLTGVGARALRRAVGDRFGDERFVEALRSLAIVVRGPKPAAVLREWKAPIAAIAPEPNTWREVLAVTEGRRERRIAVQEYGRPNPELIAGLEARGAEVTTVRVYQWDFPEDTTPLREAAHRIARGDAEFVLFTTSAQMLHLARMAAEEGIEGAMVEGLRRMVVASIGPATTETLEEYGIRPDFEPSHPKMGFLVQEVAARAGELAARKRTGSAHA
jgi:uroporphyrinogen-III synthase